MTIYNKMVDISGKNLVAGALLIGAVLIVFIGLFATGMIGGTIVGTISETVTSGAIPVSAAMNTSLAGLETDYISASEGLFNNTTLIVGLAAIVILMLVFGFKLAFGKSNDRKSVE